MLSTSLDNLEDVLEADDGVVEVARVMAHLPFRWMSLNPGPRRWAPTDLFAEVDGGAITQVRMTYRTVGDRVVVVAGAPAESAADDLARRVATPLLFAHVRRTRSDLPPVAIASSLQDGVVWDEQVGEWHFGHVGGGARPVRIAHLAHPEGHTLMASHGIAVEEHTTLVSAMEELHDGGEVARELHRRHRRALAQRWWDAPRAPWRPDS